MQGMSGDQQFFVSFAQSWRSKSREPAMRNRILADGHAPSEYRASTVRNIDAWYRAFGVKPGQGCTWRRRIGCGSGERASVILSGAKDDARARGPGDLHGPTTATGVEVVVLEPSPSCPPLSAPQQYARAAVVTPHEWASPVATPLNRSPPATATGERWSAPPGSGCRRPAGRSSCIPSR